MKLVPLYGSGKPGAGSVRTPIEDKNTLRSRATARFIDLWGEGPIEGFCTIEGVPCVDVKIKHQPTVVGGALTFPDGLLLEDADVLPGSGLPSGFGTRGSGYPFVRSTDSNEFVVCVIEGDSTTPAIIKVVVYPRNEADQTWATTNLGLGVLPVYPEGRVHSLVLFSAGKGYTDSTATVPFPVTVSIPPSTGQCIFLDDLALNDPANLTPRFKNVRYEYRLGYEDQTPLQSFDTVEELTNIAGQPVINKSPTSGPTEYTFQLDDVTYDRLVINIDLFEGFYRQNKTNGDVTEIPSTAPVTFTITQKYNQDNKGFVDVGLFGDGYFTLSGKTMSRYERSIEGTLFKNRSGAVEHHSWQITVTRTSADDPDTASHTKFGVGQIAGVTDVNLAYPNCAYIGIEISAEQFQRVPKRAYQLKLMRVKVPSNYYPPYSFRADGTMRRFAEYNRKLDENETPYESRDASNNAIEEPWDGNFYTSWTNNPAWIAYAYCTEARIGLAEYLPDISDKWGLYQIARYNDQLVRNGYLHGSFSVEEPRFQGSFYIQSPEDAFKVLTDIASSFRAMVYWASGTLIFAQDRPQAVRMSLNKTDVLDGKFTYSGTARRARHTVAIVYFNDPLANYELRPVVYEDFEGIFRYGERTVTITRVGCTSRGEARRTAMHAILSEQRLTDTLAVTARMKAAILRPGDVFSVYDPDRSSVPFGGRILNITSQLGPNNRMVSVVLADRPIGPEFLPGPILNYALVCSMSVPSVDPGSATDQASQDKVNRPQITAPVQVVALGAGPNKEALFVLNELLPDTVVKGGVWGLQSTTVKPQYFRLITSRREKKGQYSLVALEWHASIYDAIDSDTNYTEEAISPDLNAWKRPLPPKNLTLHVNSKNDGETGLLVHDLTVSWTKPDSVFVKGYRIFLQKGLGNYQFVSETPTTSVTVRLTEADSYGVRVYAEGLSGQLSFPAHARTIVGSLDGTNQEIVSGLELTGKGNATLFETGDVSFDWRVNWSLAASNLEQEFPPILPPSVKGYPIRITKPNGDTLLNDFTTESNYILTLERNRELTGGPYRDFIIKVQVQTADGGVSAATSIRVNNEVSPAPTFSVADSTAGGFEVRILSPKQHDFKRYRVWAKRTNGFTPTDADIVFEGEGTLLLVTKMALGDWYIRVAELDLLTSEVSGLTVSEDPNTNPDILCSAPALVTITQKTGINVFSFKNV